MTSDYEELCRRTRERDRSLREKVISLAEAAALANYLRVTWGGQKGDVAASVVRALR